MRRTGRAVIAGVAGVGMLLGLAACGSGGDEGAGGYPTVDEIEIGLYEQAGGRWGGDLDSGLYRWIICQQKSETDGVRRFACDRYRRDSGDDEPSNTVTVEAKSDGTWEVAED